MSQRLMPAADRRVAPRYPASGRVVLEVPGGKVEGRLLDLSLNGALVAFEVAVEIGETPMPMHVHALSGCFSATVRGVRREGLQLGLEFVDMSIEDFAQFVEIIRALQRPSVTALCFSDG